MIELMVTVAIISILAAIALPSFSSTIERQRLRLVIETVVSDFRQARSTAEAQGARGSSTIEFSVNGGDGFVHNRIHRGVGDDRRGCQRSIVKLTFGKSTAMSGT